jgi:hypothetical protein
MGRPTYAEQKKVTNQHGLRPYMVFVDEPWEDAELVVAHNAKEARMFARYLDFDRFIDLRATLIVGHSIDPIQGIEQPRLVGEIPIQRQFGFGVEGDERCNWCDLATWDGMFPVCQDEDCQACADCGCVDECTLKTFPIPDRAAVS